MTSLSFPFTLTAGQNENVNQLNSNLAAIQTVINGNIDATNITALAISTALLANLAVTTGKIADNAVTAAKIEAQQAWQTIAFAAGTFNPSSLSYYKDSLGRVWIYPQVHIVSVSPGSSVFATLPVGYRPGTTVVGMAFNPTNGTGVTAGQPVNITAGGAMNFPAGPPGGSFAIQASWRAEN